MLSLHAVQEIGLIVSVRLFICLSIYINSRTARRILMKSVMYVMQLEATKTQAY
jgi:hypothetical protein